VSRLIALEKEDGGIRPIAIGEALYRLVAKAILQALFHDNILLPFQLGVKSPGGVEPAVFLLQQAIHSNLQHKFSHVTSLDFSNAFNSLSRRDIATGVV